MHDVCVTQPKQTRQVQRLVDERSQIGPATDPSQSGREDRIDRQERDWKALAGERSDQTDRLYSVAAEEIETRGNDDDSRVGRSHGRQ